MVHSWCRHGREPYACLSISIFGTKLFVHKPNVHVRSSVTLACRRRQKKLAKAAKGKSAVTADSHVPVNGVYPFTCLGVTSEAFGDALTEYISTNPHNTLKGEMLLVPSWTAL